jgi:hypothetical protein
MPTRRATVTALAALLAIMISVGDSRAARQSANPHSSRLEGTWVYTATIPGLGAPFPDTFKGLVTFFPGGSVVENSWAPDLTTNTGAGQGVWVKVRDHEFTFTFAFLWLDQGQLFVLGKAHATITVDGDEASGGVTFETLDTLDPGGTVLHVGTGTLRATRLRAD